MNTSPCPSIDELDPAAPLDSRIAQHLDECAPCAGLRAICALRHADGDDEPEEGRCAAFEPLIAAMLDGSIEEREADELREHLERCPSCAQLMGSLSLLRHELEQLPQPEVLEADVVPTDGLPAPSGRRGKGGARGGPLAALMPRRAWVWVVELAAVAAVALWVGHWLGVERSASVAPEIQPVAGLDRPSAPPPAATIPALAAHPHERQSAGQAGAAAAGVPLGGGGAAALAARRATGRLNVTCQPMCSSVRLDGKSVGATPVRRTVPAGVHALTLQREGVDKHITVHVRAGETTSVVVDMSPESSRHRPRAQPPGFLNVVCRPACESVRIDGRDLGPSPVVRHSVAPGQHRLTLRSGRLTRPVTVLVKSSETKSLHIVMQAPGR